jgi:hypothetical protein
MFKSTGVHPCPTPLLSSKNSDGVPERSKESVVHMDLTVGKEIMSLVGGSAR